MTKLIKLHLFTKECSVIEFTGWPGVNKLAPRAVRLLCNMDHVLGADHLENSDYYKNYCDSLMYPAENKQFGMIIYLIFVSFFQFLTLLFLSCIYVFSVFNSRRSVVRHYKHLYLTVN